MLDPPPPLGASSSPGAAEGFEVVDDHPTSIGADDHVESEAARGLSLPPPIVAEEPLFDFDEDGNMTMQENQGDQDDQSQPLLMEQSNDDGLILDYQDDFQQHMDRDQVSQLKTKVGRVLNLIANPPRSPRRRSNIPGWRRSIPS